MADRTAQLPFDTYPPPGPGARRVLVVDDSLLQRRILVRALHDWGYEVEEAASAEEAMACCTSRPPDLVLSDWVMPGMSGVEFCKALRALMVSRYVYFILLTGKTDKRVVARGLEWGADDFLIKPVNSEELRARLKAGERILDMRRELTEKNRIIGETLHELQRVYDSLEHDLQQARKLQQSLLRERHRLFDGAALSQLLRPSGHVGGDLVGHFPAGPGQIGLYAIDVSGHGISSALMTARLAGYLSASAPDQNVALRKGGAGYVARPPAEVVHMLNDLVLNEMGTDHYFAFLLAFVDLATGRVCVSQAGQPHPVIQRADGRIEQSGTGGFPVGLLQNASFDQFDLFLSPGDSLWLLSDGFTECPDPDGNLLGEQGLARMMMAEQGTRGEARLNGLVRQLETFAVTDEFPDDISGILLEYQGRRAA